MAAEHEEVGDIYGLQIRFPHIINPTVRLIKYDKSFRSVLGVTELEIINSSGYTSPLDASFKLKRGTITMDLASSTAVISGAPFIDRKIIIQQEYVR